MREIESRLGVADRLAACAPDPRAAERIEHGIADILRFRMLMIAAGYEDGNDAASLAARPGFQARPRPDAGGCRTVLAADHLAAREPARTARADPHGARHGGALLEGIDGVTGGSTAV